eukprot:TRINITY_DN792_c0_g2_i1.p1 TRINITY_DN792_c0_g2~~TRINITY_DN792_c0_g2_i1.p1  ORF type:complete len:537 (-),score=132.40 TRINITY_DN792_c0_g2_i1:579-2189(-)
MTDSPCTLDSPSRLQKQEAPSGEASQEDSLRSELEVSEAPLSASKIFDPSDFSDKEAEVETHTDKKDDKNKKSLKKLMKSSNSRKDLYESDPPKEDETGSSSKKTPTVKKDRKEKKEKKEKKSRKIRESLIPPEFDRPIERSPSSPASFRLDEKRPFNLSASSKNIRKDKEQDREGLTKHSSFSDADLSRVSEEADEKDSQDDSKPKEKTRPTGTLDEAIALFNTNPKHGVKFLFDHRLLPNTPEDLASFFHQNLDLEKKQISDYLSSNTDVAKAALKQFMRQMDFMNLQYDQALRQLLNTFVLPREAQQIDRVMEAFAYEYYHQNISTSFCSQFEDSECLYMLAYSLVILNTDAHNPQVKNKMTLEQFFQNNRGINKKKDLPQQYLASLYQRIVKEEMKTSVDQSFPNAIIKGWLLRLEGKGKTSKGKNSAPRWCVLNNDHCLYIFKKPKDESQEPVAKFNLINGATIELQAEEEAQPLDEYSTTQYSNAEGIRRGRLNFPGKISSFAIYETVIPQDCSENVVRESLRFSARSSK